MNLKHALVASLTVLALPLAAEDPVSTFKAGLILTQHGQLKPLTQKSTGYNYELAVMFPDAGGLGLDLAPYVGYFKIDATSPAATEAERYSMQAWRVGLDMVWARGKVFGQDLAFKTGPLMTTYVAVGMRNPVQLTNKEWKLGWRAGVELDITKKWTVSFDATVSEWRSDTDKATVQNINPNNPFYWNLMVGYRF